MKELSELRFIRVFTPDHLPRYLVEQVRDRDYTVDDFYKYQAINTTVPGPNGPTLNPFHHLYVLVDQENITKGFTWFNIDPLTKDVIIQVYSVDKEYWGKGRAVEKLADFIKSFMRKGKLKKVYWVTNYEKHSMRHGFIRSKSVLMEYSLDEEVKKPKKEVKQEESLVLQEA